MISFIPIILKEYYDACYIVYASNICFCPLVSRFFNESVSCSVCALFLFANVVWIHNIGHFRAR